MSKNIGGAFQGPKDDPELSRNPVTPSQPPEQGGDPEKDKSDIADGLRKKQQHRGNQTTPSGGSGPNQP